MKFTVLEHKRTDVGAHRAAGFYYHARNGGKVNLPSQQFPTLAHAIRAVEQLWFAFGKAQKHGLALRVGMTYREFAKLVPVPWARDSLKPAKRKQGGA